MNNNEELEIDLLRLFRALWQKAFIISITAIFAAIIFAAVSIIFITPQYKAKALMYVNSTDTSQGGSKVSISQSELNAAKTLVDTYIVIMNSRSTLDEVIAQSGVPYTYNQIVGNKMISASAVNDTEVFAIEATSPNPAEAALLANTVAKVLPDKIVSIVDGTSVRVVDYAVAPTSPSSPNIVKNAMLGGILGFVFACAIVVIAELMDDLIRDPDYLFQTYDLPVLAVIPDLLSSKGNSGYYQSTEVRARK